MLIYLVHNFYVIYVTWPIIWPMTPSTVKNDVKMVTSWLEPAHRSRSSVVIPLRNGIMLPKVRGRGGRVIKAFDFGSRDRSLLEGSNPNAAPSFSRWWPRDQRHQKRGNTSVGFRGLLRLLLFGQEKGHCVPGGVFLSIRNGNIPESSCAIICVTVSI